MGEIDGSDRRRPGVRRKTQAVKEKGCNVRVRLKATAKRAKSGSVNFLGHLSKRTLTKKYLSEGTAAQLRHSDTIRHPEHARQRKDADPKIGGQRYRLRKGKSTSRWEPVAQDG